MANDLTKFMGQQLAVALQIYRKKSTLLNQVGRTYDALPGGKNSTIEIPSVLPGVINDFVPGPVPVAPADSGTGMDYLLVDRHKYASWSMTDRDIDQVNPNFLQRRIEQAVEDLVGQINKDIWNTAYKTAYNTVGAIGTGLFAGGTVDIAADAWEALARNNVPGDNLCAILDTRSYANAIKLPAFYQYYSSNQDGVMRNAQLGRQFGFDWMYDQHATRHAAGTATGYLTTALQVVGSNTVAVGTGTGAFNPGDVFTVAGDAQQYSVVFSTATQITFLPMAQVAWASGAAITKLASHNISIAFHKDALQFGSRPCEGASKLHNELGGKKYMNMYDPVGNTNLQMRVISGNGMIIFEIHQIYGLKNVRPAATVRMIS